jgi:hypothetical protein
MHKQTTNIKKEKIMLEIQDILHRASMVEAKKIFFGGR